ncbi:MAG: hypothetical protein AB7O44_12930 [Hyphomicrobiaceae bacterium]
MKRLQPPQAGGFLKGVFELIDLTHDALKTLELCFIELDSLIGVVERKGRPDKLVGRLRQDRSREDQVAHEFRQVVDGLAADRALE